jgi:hypothetical protein
LRGCGFFAGCWPNLTGGENDYNLQAEGRGVGRKKEKGERINAKEKLFFS